MVWPLDVKGHPRTAQLTKWKVMLEVERTSTSIVEVTVNGFTEANAMVEAIRHARGALCGSEAIIPDGLIVKRTLKPGWQFAALEVTPCVTPEN